MIRFLYGQVLRMHPSAFRRRFSAEMLLAFDEAVARGPFVLLADSCVIDATVVSALQAMGGDSSDCRCASRFHGFAAAGASSLWYGAVVRELRHLRTRTPDRCRCDRADAGRDNSYRGLELPEPQ